MVPLDRPTWAQLGPQSLSRQMPGLNIWPHLPATMGILEPSAELEEPSPALCSVSSQLGEGQGWPWVTGWRQSRDCPSLGFPGGTAAPLASAVPVLPLLLFGCGGGDSVVLGASGRSLLPRVTNLSQFAGERSGLSTANPV